MKKLKVNLEEQNKNENNYEKLLQETRIDISEDIKQQPVAVSIGTSLYKGNNYYIPFGSYGDFSCIVGASKSRKTFLKSAIVAGYIGGLSNNYFPDIKGHNTKDKFVLEFDTEQSKFHTQRVLRRVTEMIGGTYDYYEGFSLRKLEPKERLELIEYTLYESEYKDNIGLVTIDGYADLIKDFNNLEESTMLSNKLLKWTDEKKIHITGILHSSFGTKKPTGHAGSSILKKAETVVFTEADGDFTKVTCDYSRNKSFDDFSFTVDSSTWLPQIIDDYNQIENNNKFI